MDFTQYVLLAAVIAGVTELINRLRGQDYWVVASIATAGLVGGVFGYFGISGLPDVATGVAAGFGASGALKAVASVGRKSDPAPSTLVTKAPNA
jgi:uncharacterized membrane protein HdeD (DUF308 family)